MFFFKMAPKAPGVLALPLAISRPIAVIVVLSERTWFIGANATTWITFSAWPVIPAVVWLQPFLEFCLKTVKHQLIGGSAFEGYG